MLGKLLNGLVEKAVDKWLGSESSRRYATSAITRGLGYVMVAFLAWLSTEYGLSEETRKAVEGHWSSIVSLLGPVLGIAIVELVSKARAKLNAKAMEIAVAAPSNSLTPETAKEVAKVSLEKAKE